jgi:hypothetical protein
VADSAALYVASHGRYVLEAVLSAASVRQAHGELPIVLFTAEPLGITGLMFMVAPSSPGDDRDPGGS